MTGEGMGLTLRDVVLSYGGAPVVDDLHLDVRPGEILVLTGPSGCGKSTVLRALAGLLTPDRGDLLADGAPIVTTSRDRAMVFQDNALLPWRTVQSNVELALKLAGRPRAGRREEALRWISDVGLTGFERYLAGSSRGLEAEALVGRARALGRLGRRDLEASAWQEVQRKYPSSIYGRQAGERLSALGLQ